MIILVGILVIVILLLMVTKNKDPFTSQYQMHYINLDRRPDRNEKIIEELKKSNILNNSCQRFSAIDGRTLNYCNDPIKKGWIGCAESHIALWRKCLQENTNFVIFEDDFHLNSKFDYNYGIGVQNLPKDFDIIYLLVSRLTNKHKTHYNQYFDRIYSGNYLLTGYIISPKGAHKLLKTLTPFNPSKQIDGWIVSLTKSRYLKCYSFKDPLIWTFQTYDSDVQYNLQTEQLHGKIE